MATLRRKLDLSLVEDEGLIQSKRRRYCEPNPKDAAFFLARAAKEPAFGINHAEVESKSRGVVMRYPVAQSLDPILADPRVTFARRMTCNAGHGRKEPTQQVEVLFRGALPETLDLGFWGVFYVRRFIPEPLRCFQCHAFGHTKRYCRRELLCGVCSGKHPTWWCKKALRAGMSRTAQCPNCGRGHYAWFRACPERLRRLLPWPAREILSLLEPSPVQKAMESVSSQTTPVHLQDAASQYHV
nr:MAG: hypothetical protein [Sesarmops intermedium nimavirus]